VRSPRSHSSKPRPALPAFLGVLAVALALAACTGGSAGSSPESGATPTAGGTTTSTRSPSFFTGEPVDPHRPVLAVKIDNVAPARPQTGLTSADVVYVEPVEGGLSRMLAIFSGRLPKLVGPVRSARESDLDLLRQYGPAGFAFSGANRGVLNSVQDSDLVELSPGQVSAAYSRRGPHVAPHNLYAEPAALLKKGTGVATAHDVGFRFGALPAGGKAAGRTVVRYGAATTAFTWSAARKSWTVSLDGRTATTTDGGRLAPATVVVQDTEVSQSKYHDTLGNPTPFTETVGSGQATVLRDGRTFSARWSRPSASGGTTFTTADGAPLPFATGQVWIVFRKK
jgi:hypothetical protein